MMTPSIFAVGAPDTVEVLGAVIVGQLSDLMKARAASCHDDMPSWPRRRNMRLSRIARRGRGAFIGNADVGSGSTRLAGRPSSAAMKLANAAQLVSPCDVQW